MDRLRGRHLLRQRERVRMVRPLCPHCEAEGLVRLGEELDHIVPLHTAKRNPARFAELLKDDNVQLLCVEHHRAKTAKDMGYTPRTQYDENGNPVTEHHWRTR